MRQLYYLLFLCVLLWFSFTDGLKAQTCTAPSIAVDLSANPDTTWRITNISRNGLCCNLSNCIKFDITVNPQTAQIGFNVLNPAPTGNSAYYEVNCGPATSLGTRLCVSGMTTFSITFCKTGNDQPAYTISASRGYSTSGDIAVRADGNCTGQMNVKGLQKSTITWNSIYPGAQGVYNSYLSCTSGCDTTYVTPTSGAPSYIDYKVCGTVTGCATGAVCSTIRVYTYPALTVAITPVNPSICSGGPSSVTLTAIPTGGNPSYIYNWTGPNGFTSTLQSPTITAAGLYTVSVSDNTICSPVTKTVTVVASTTPTITSAATSSVCSGVAQNYTITSGVSGTTYNWSRASVAGISNTAVSGQSGNPITETLINTTSAPVSVTYVITPTANGCTGTPFSYTVTVNPTPTVTSAAAATICNNTAQNYTITSGVSGTTYSWSRAAAAGISNAAVSGQSGNPITETLTNTTNAPVSVTYVITPTANGCTGTPFTYTVTVKPTPTVTSAAAATICNNTAQNYTITSAGSGTTYNWSRASVAGISNTAVTGQSGNPITETLTNTTSAPVSVTYVITPTANGCTGTPFTYTVTANPTATVTSAAAATICNNTAQNYTITSGVSGTTYSWSRAAAAGISNTAVSGQSGNPLTETLTNTTSAPVSVTYVITPTANRCTGTPFTYTVMVNPTPTVTSAAAATICNNTAQNYTITSAVSGTTYSWSRAAAAGISNAAVSGQSGNPITETLTNTTSAPVSVTYVITPTANGCTGTPFTYTVTVNPTPTVTSAAAATICNNTAQNYTITSAVSGTTYSWSRAAAAGISNAAVSGQSGNPITETLTNTTSAPVSVTYVITPTANGCTGTPFTYTVTVNPTPTVTSAAAATICNNTAQSYTITSAVSGTTYSWSRAAAAGISNAAVSGQSGKPLTETLTNTTSAPVSVTYVITPTANGCAGTPFTYTVTVNPTPTVTSAAAATICNNTAQNYTITSAVSGTTYNWSRTASAGISNAAVTGQSGNPITETLINTTIAPVSVTYVITPTANGCTGNPFTYTVTVNPTPTVTSAAAATICNNTAQNYTITSAVSGTTYSWSRAAAAGISNAAVSGQSGNPITETLTNTTSAPVSVTYVITPTANGCTGTPFTYTVTVNPTPTVTSAAAATICNNTAQNYTITSAVSGTTYSWSRAAAAGISNAALSGQSGNPITETLTNTTSAPVSVTYVITPTANGCTGTPFTYTVTVNPTPTITSAAAATICNNTAQNYTITSGVSGTTYSWSRAAAAGISNGAASGQRVNSITESLINTTNALVNVTYVIVPSANECTGPAFNYIVTVNPTPTVTSASSVVICSDVTQNYDITSAVSGTIYTWSRAAVAGISNVGVTGQFANPITEALTNTTIGVVNVKYTILPNINGCTGTPFTYTVIVNPKPATPAIGSNSPVCTGNDLNLNISTTEGATYGWTGPNGFSSTLPNPTIASTTLAAAGTYLVNITLNGCSSTAGTSTILINATPPAPKVFNNGPLCEGATLHLTASTVEDATYHWTGPDGFTSTIQNPSLPAAVYTNSGKYYVTATVGGCTGLADSSMTVIVNDNPTDPILKSNSPVCTGGDILLTASTTRGANYIWTGPNGYTSSVQNPSMTKAVIANGGTYNVSISSAGCPNTSSGSIAIAVNPTPNAPTATNNGPVCDGSSLNLFASAIPNALYNWTGPHSFTSTSQNPVINNITTAKAGTYSVTVTVNDCTSAVATTYVTIKPVPPAPTAGNNTPVCDGRTVNLTASTIAGATYTWTGQNGFTSAIQNPTIANATFTDAGKYYVAATVAGCTGLADSAAVIINANPTPPNLFSNSPVCSGGSLQLNAATIIGANYSWTGPDGFKSLSQNPIIPDAVLSNSGTYKVSITAAGCPSTTSSSIDVMVNKTPNAPTAMNNGPVCEGTTLNLSASPIYDAAYYWTGPDNFTATDQNPEINTSIKSTGTYNVTATVKGCTSSPAKTVAVIKQKPAASAGSNQTVCANNALVNIAGIITGGSTTGRWSTSGTGMFSPANTNLTAAYTPGNADKAEGNVTLTLTSTNNSVCPASVSSTTVTITNAPIANAGSDQSVCANNSNVILNGQVTTATGGVWSTSGTGTFNPSDTNLNATYIPGARDITKGTVTLTLTTTGNGMCSQVADELKVAITPAPVVKAGPDLYILESGTATLNPVVSGANVQYLWTPNNYLNNNTVKNPLVTGVEDILYTLKVTDINGCINEGRVMVKVLKPFKIPNTFTPNNDGINDRWLIPALNTYPGNHVQVFNRYGQLVFESSGYSEPWDGTMNGKSLPFGTYYYVIESGYGRKPITGYVTLIK